MPRSLHPWHLRPEGVWGAQHRRCLPGEGRKGGPPSALEAWRGGPWARVPSDAWARAGTWAGARAAPVAPAHEATFCATRGTAVPRTLPWHTSYPRVSQQARCEGLPGKLRP